MSRFLDTLKSIIQPEPITPVVVIEPTPPSYPTAATNLLHHQHFLLSIVLAVLLFVVILPVYETLFGGHDDDDDDDDDDVRNERSNKTGECYEEGSLRIYKPGVGIVTMNVEDIAEMTLVRVSSGGSNTGSSSCGGSSRSVGSHGSCSMETIEESEEEEDVIVNDDCDES